MADLLRTSNPTLNGDAFRNEGMAYGDTMTISGTVNTLMTILICSGVASTFGLDSFALKAHSPHLNSPSSTREL